MVQVQQQREAFEFVQTRCKEIKVIFQTLVLALPPSKYPALAVLIIKGQDMSASDIRASKQATEEVLCHKNPCPPRHKCIFLRNSTATGRVINLSRCVKRSRGASKCNARNSSKDKPVTLNS